MAALRKEMNLQNLLFLWLAISILLGLFSQAALWLFLRRRRRVSINHFFVGTPGYLDTKYVWWCRENERSYFLLIALRVLLLANIILVTVAVQKSLLP